MGLRIILLKEHTCYDSIHLLQGCCQDVTGLLATDFCRERTAHGAPLCVSQSHFKTWNQMSTSVLTLVLLNPDILCLCKQCRSRSVGFWRSQLIWICTVCHSVYKFLSTTWIKESDWLKIRRGWDILIYSAWQGLTLSIGTPYLLTILVLKLKYSILPSHDVSKILLYVWQTV